MAYIQRRPFPLPVLVKASAVMAEATSKVCAICNEKHKLKEIRNDAKGHGCCDGCGGVDGYLHDHHPDEIVDAMKLEYGFDKQRGFLGPEGCKLPRERRSFVCIDFTCQKLVGAAVVTGTWDQFNKAHHADQKMRVEFRKKNGW